MQQCSDAAMLEPLAELMYGTPCAIAIAKAPRARGSCVSVWCVVVCASSDAVVHCPSAACSFVMMLLLLSLLLLGFGRAHLSHHPGPYSSSSSSPSSSSSSSSSASHRNKIPTNPQPHPTAAILQGDGHGHGHGHVRSSRILLYGTVRERER